MIMVEKVSSNFILEDEKIVKIKDYNVMTNGRNFFDQPIKSDLKDMITLERLEQVKVMIAQQDVY